MPDNRKAADRGVVDSIARLRNLRYMTKGPGAKRAAPAKPTVDQLRADVAKVTVKPKKKAKKRRSR
jgi:hypothetical protein